MRKLLTLLLAVAASIETMFAWDYERVQIGDLYYNLDATNQTAEMTSQNGGYPYWSTSITTANIPASVTYNEVEYSVTSIGHAAFYECIGLTSVAIPNSVTSIENSAFWGCSDLTSVTIPNSVTSIDHYAFYLCRSLTSVTIPNSVTSIGWGVFEYCSDLTSMTIPNSFTSIRDATFYECNSLSSVTIPNSVTSIENYAFDGCSSLASVTNYATTPQAINNNVFYNVNKSSCTLYVPKESVSAYQSTEVWSDFENILPIPPSVIASGECGAEGDNLTWELSNYGVLTVRGSGEMADFYIYENPAPWYSNQASIYSVIIEDGVTTIGTDAFRSCTNLTSVTIPNSVLNIKGSFYDCSALPSIVIPSSVTNIGVNTFGRCSSLTSIDVAADNPNYSSGNGVLFDKEKRTIIQYPNGKDGAYVVPNSVTTIGTSAFVWSDKLSSMTIPNSVTSIGDGAFYNCTKLSSIEIPEGITRIEDQTFFGCNSLVLVKLPNTITYIGYRAFFECTGLTTIILPHSLTLLGTGAFESCSNLTSIISNANIPPSVANRGFKGVNKSTCKLYVPAESVSAYQSATNWSDFQIGGAAMSSKADPDDASAFYTTFYHSTQKYKLPVGMEAYTATINGEVLELTKVAEEGDVIPADEAFILKSNAANLTMDITEETPVSIGENILQGVDVATSAPANCYVLSGKSSDNSVKGIGFYRFSGTLGAHKAYLVLNPKAGAPRRLRFAFSETNTATGVEEVQREDKGEWRKVLRNGQLYIMHEGEIYDVRGSRVQ